MSSVAKKLLFSKASSLTTGQFTKGVLMGASDGTAVNVADVDDMSIEDNVASTSLNVAYASSVDSTRDLAFYSNALADELTCVDFSDISNISITDSIIDSDKFDFTRGVAADPTTGNATAFTLKVIQDSTARTITWPASVDWAGGTAPTLTATSGGVDVFVFYTIDGGTTYYGFTAGQAMA